MSDMNRGLLLSLLCAAMPLAAQEAADPDATPLDEVIVRPPDDPLSNADQRLNELKTKGLPGLGSEAALTPLSGLRRVLEWAFVPQEPEYLGPGGNPDRVANDIRVEAELRNAGRDKLP